MPFDRATSAEGRFGTRSSGPAGGFVMDAFDRFWQWADKPPESLLTIPAELHRAVLELTPEDRRDRAAVNQAAARVPDPE
jgi:hypothetical protein